MPAGRLLNHLLRSISNRRRDLADACGDYVPIAIKLAPDLTRQAIPPIAAAISRHGIDAVIATNTTISREGVEGLTHAEESGGLSGRPLFKKSNTVLSALKESLPAEVSLIGVGGILEGQDAARKYKLGADLVQFYTGFIYRGPELVSEAVRAIREQSGGG